MSALITYLTNSFDSPQVVLTTAGIAAATVYGFSKYVREGKALQKMIQIQKQPQTVEIGEAKNGEGRSHRRIGFEKELLLRIDPEITTSHELFEKSVKKCPEKNCFGTRKKIGEDQFGDYEWLSFKQAAIRRKNIAAGLIKQFDLKPKDFVGIYSINRPEWMLTDLACAYSSFSSIALYDTLGQNAVEFIIKHAEIKVIVCAKKQLSIILASATNCPSLKYVVAMDPISNEDLETAKKANIQLITLKDLEEVGAKNPVEPNPPKPDDIYTIMYTSGTTGDPKGVILTHKNLVAEVSGVYNHDSGLFDEDDVHISYLPLAHSMERAVTYFIVSNGSAVGYFSGNIINLFNDIACLRPTFLVGAPRVWSRLHDKLIFTINGGGFVKKTLFHYGFQAKANAIKKGLESPVWDKILFSKTKARLGGRVKFILSGSAPLDPKLAEFLKICFCCPVLEGYGLTENFAGAFITLKKETQFGHVGSILACTEAKLVDVEEMNYSSKQNPPTGEIMLRGNNVFKGYYKDEEKTKEVFDEDNWFHTGDIGRWNANGTLSIIDRKKNIFKLSQGEYVAVEYLEGIYLRSPFVAQIWVYGNSYKRYLLAVAVPDPEFLAKWASENGISGDFNSLCNNEKVKKAIHEDIIKQGKKASLHGFEFIKEIHVTSDAFTVDNDLMTPTFKLRRVQLLKYYQKQIDELYKQIGE